ncbi:SHSP domain-containing protein [Mycena chlorophos]|uniref:SHSP domain-containing protein n=1 Tax=Mycena chlorophos TaxID=658473 RepID=A0A8H6W3P2_MYCCL|nr:SHSP domain-containing protein [Mycena chlorophos]
MESNSGAPNCQDSPDFVPAIPRPPPHTTVIHSNLSDEAILRGVRSGVLKLAIPRAAANLHHPVHAASASFIPRMEVVDDPTQPTTSVTFELPGVKAPDIILLPNPHSNVLTIQGRREPRNRCQIGVESTTQGDSAPPAVVPAGSPSTTRDSGRLERRAQYSGRDLALQAQARARAQISRNRPVASELRYGEFLRRVRLPPGVDIKTLKATLGEGMLTVSWTRPPGSAPLASTNSPATGSDADEVAARKDNQDDASDSSSDEDEVKDESMQHRNPHTQAVVNNNLKRRRAHRVARRAYRTGDDG